MNIQYETIVKYPFDLNIDKLSENIKKFNKLVEREQFDKAKAMIPKMICNEQEIFGDILKGMIEMWNAKIEEAMFIADEEYKIQKAKEAGVI